ncbi:MAG: arginase family protein [Mycobacteriales bacterium]|nr:arginase family protein [Mycobacteriales bacterium]
MTDDPLWPRASTLLGPPAGQRVGVVGVPLHRSSISPSRADLTPVAVRAALHRFPTWHAGLDVDLPALADHGDLDVADLTGTAAVEAARAGVAALPSYDLLVLLGGDNLVTWPALQALAPDLSRAGLLTLDAHHDVRGWHAGPTNGTPVRGLLEAGLPGRHVVQVGIGELTNSREYAGFCRAEGITTVGLADCRGRVGEVVTRELDRLALTCDVVYVDLDVDVVDRAFVPGCPGARPGGLLPHELLEAAVAAGKHRSVRAVDVTEVDAAADMSGITVQLAAMCLLSVAAGWASR